MVHPQKWRDTCDPFALAYHHFQPTEIIGYPPARNDVFHARGIYNGEETTAYIKVARHEDSAIENEVSILSQLDDSIFPNVLDADFANGGFSVTTDLTGLRLSVIVGANEDMASLSYMEAYGEALGKLHGLKPTASQQADRKFYHCPPRDMLENLDLAYLENYFSNAPSNVENVFCHGDFHYANVLWEDRHISAILDFELSGYGNRDMDIAWAIFLRPGQRFLKTEEERGKFLDGYRKFAACDEAAVKYYTAQFYVWFLNSCSDDAEYSDYIRRWLAANCVL